MKSRVPLGPGKFHVVVLVTGAQPSPKAGTGLKMQTVRFFNVTLLGIYRWLRYIAGSLLWLAHWNLIRHFKRHWRAGMEDIQEKDCSFLFPNLYYGLVYERKFKSEYLERQIYERSWFKLIENKSDLSKLSTLSEPSIVKFIENQSEHLSKLTLYHLKKRATRRSRRAPEPSRIPEEVPTRRIACWRNLSSKKFQRLRYRSLQSSIAMLIRWETFQSYTI